MNGPTNRIFGLDLIRAVAIVFVVLAHGLPLIGRHTPVYGWKLGHLSSFGAELFFVLSGFLIGGILMRMEADFTGPRALFGFLIRRWFRTLPNYFLFLALNIPFMIYVMGGRPPWSEYLPRFLIFTQSFVGPPLPFFLESWTLAIEEWFYLFTPLGILVFRLLLGTFSRGVLATAAIMLVVPLLLRMGAAGEGDWSFEIRMVTTLRLDALIYGIIAAWLQHRYRERFRQVRWIALIAGLALSYWNYQMLFKVNLDQSYFAKTWLFCLIPFGFALLLPWGANATASAGRWLVRGVQRVALWSYALYLINLPVGYVLIHRTDGWYERSAFNGWAATVAYWVVCLGLSAVVYRWFERPMMNLRERFAISRSRSPRTL
ncbi:MAG TPA: acyltransferase [Opitutaceae bacterium]|nr:acyltransferase [Opitutaceae bacterium]